jgi:uncharacterized protein YcbK (DUF882 family)
MQITRHFHADEFDCHNGDPYPDARVETHLRPLCEALEVIREEISAERGRDTPLAVISGYRSPRYNKAVKGAKKSRHVEGDGADVRAMGVSPAVLHATALRLHRAGKIRLGGLGLYRGWIHVDVRPGALAQWTGSGVGSEVAA